MGENNECGLGCAYVISDSTFEKAGRIPDCPCLWRDRESREYTVKRWSKRDRGERAETKKTRNTKVESERRGKREVGIPKFAGDGISSLI